MSIELTRAEIASYYRDRLPELLQTAAQEWHCPCPIHNGTGHNFAIDAQTGQWYCHSQCGRGGDIISLEQELGGLDFLPALENIGGVIGRDLRNEDEEHRHQWDPLRVFHYRDEHGNSLFDVLRQDCQSCSHKRIWQQQPDGTKNLDGVRRVPYQLPAIATAATVYIVEGEPKADALAKWDLVATCNPGGSGKWLPEFNPFLHGKKIVILPDNDKPGKQHAIDIARQLEWNATVHIVELPGLLVKGDIIDWIAAGHTGEELVALVDASQPETAATINSREIAWGLVEPLEPPNDQQRGVEPLAREAFHGVIGDFVKIVLPHTEADEAALLGSMLVASGNYLSRNTYYVADGSKHYGNEFLAIVGDSSKGRKGTSFNRVRDVIEMADPKYFATRILSGLSSGEGVIWAVRDEIIAQQPIRQKGQITGYEAVVADSGVNDKRLLNVEGELCRSLKSMRRETNTLSAILRESWDHGTLNILTKNNPVTATGAHISIVGHITSDELRRNLTETDTANGFANRFLWFCSKRSKILPFGGSLEPGALEPIAARLQNAALFSQDLPVLRFDDEAAREWERVYPELSEGGRGLVGAITSRSEAHAVRIALIYALLDLKKMINIEHLRAALAVVDYSNRSVAHIFGRSLGDTTADEILRELTKAGNDGLTRNDIYNHFGKNKGRSEIQRALDLLLRDGLAKMEPEATGGRSAERWYVLREKASATKKPTPRALLPKPPSAERPAQAA